MWGWSQSAGRVAPMGVRIGWLTGDDVLLDESASYRVAEQIFDAGPLLMNERAVRLHLRKWGLLASIDTARQVLLVRRTLEGPARQVLHLKSNILKRGIRFPG